MGTGAVLLFVSVTLPAAAFASEIHVPGDFGRLADALEAALPGDTISLDAGIHRGPFFIRTDDLLVEGHGGRIVQGGSALRSRSEDSDAVVVVLGDRVTLRGLDISRGGVRIEGDDGMVEQCVLRRCGDRRHTASAVDIRGSGATIRMNRFSGGRGRFQGIRSTGARTEVWRNAISLVRDGAAIDVSADEALVSGNTVADFAGQEALVLRGNLGVVEGNEVDIVEGGSAVLVEGDGDVLTGNRVSAGTLDGPVVLLDGADGRVTDNEVGSRSATGVEVRGERARVEGNRIYGGLLVEGSDGVVLENDMAAGETTGILVRGDRSRIEGNTVGSLFVPDDAATFGHGIVVRGAENVLRENRSWGAPADGIRVVGGEGNRIDGCEASRSGACGLLNVTTGTTVTGSTFVSNGTDVINGGSFSTFDGNTFETGSSAGSDFTGGIGLEDDLGIEGVAAVWGAWSWGWSGVEGASE